MAKVLASVSAYFGNPIPPLSPFPLSRGRGTGYIREASPLFDSPLVSLSFKEEGEGILKEGRNPS